MGGSRFRIVELDPDRATVLRAALGEIDDHNALNRGREFVRLLLENGFVHPAAQDSTAGAGPTAADVDVVIPHRNDHDGLARLLSTLPVDHFASVTVVDDGSATPPGRAPNGVEVVAHRERRGPSAARNTGAARGRAPIVLFLDADVVLPYGVTPDDWLQPALDDLRPTAIPVDGIGLRVVAETGNRRDLAARYERERPVNDMGSQPGPVVPGGRIPYLPSAALLVRREALERIGGFDEDLLRGEDVDLVWRLLADGCLVRYQPKAVVGHAPRPDLRSRFRQRFGYGTGSAVLAQRHPGAVAALEVNPWTLVTWALLLTGKARWMSTGVGLATLSVPLLARRLPSAVERPMVVAARLAGGGTAGAGPILADSVRRSWLPGVLVAAVWSRRARIALAASALPPLARRWRNPPSLNLGLCWVLDLADDAAYAVGQWWGATRELSPRALCVRFQDMDDLLVRGELAIPSDGR